MGEPEVGRGASEEADEEASSALLPPGPCHLGSNQMVRLGRGLGWDCPGGAAWTQWAERGLEELLQAPWEEQLAAAAAASAAAWSCSPRSALRGLSAASGSEHTHQNKARHCLTSWSNGRRPTAADAHYNSTCGFIHIIPNRLQGTAGFLTSSLASLLR